MDKYIISVNINFLYIIIYILIDTVYTINLFYIITFNRSLKYIR